MSRYGILDPYKKDIIEDSLNAPRKTITMTYTPSTIDENQDLIIRIPKIGSNQVLVTDTLKLLFNFRCLIKLNQL